MMPVCIVQNIAHPQRKPIAGEKARVRYTYTPPVDGSADASSAAMSDPPNVRSRASVRIRRSARDDKPRCSTRSDNLRHDIHSTQRVEVFSVKALDRVELFLHRRAVLRVRGEVEEQCGHRLRVDDETLVADFAEGVRLHLVGMIGSVGRLGAETDAGNVARHTPRLLITLGLPR